MPFAATNRLWPRPRAPKQQPASAFAQILKDAVYSAAHFPAGAAPPLLQRMNVLAVTGISDHIENSVNDLGIHVVKNIPKTRLARLKPCNQTRTNLAIGRSKKLRLADEKKYPVSAIYRATPGLRGRQRSEHITQSSCWLTSIYHRNKRLMRVW